MSLRLAFVGRRVEHERWTLTHPAHGIEPLFVEARETDAGEQLDRFRPDVVVVFAPHRDQPELPRDAIAVAYVDEPIQLVHGDTQDPWAPGDDLDYALETSGGLKHLAAFDPKTYDRVIAADPLLPRVAPQLDVWRCPPLPVDDSLYLDPRKPTSPPKALFLGESDERRERYLMEQKHFYDLTHYAFGLHGDELRDVLARANVGVVLHKAPVPSYSPEVQLFLAAGHLVVSEPLVPRRGLEPWLDHVVIEAPDQLRRVLHQLKIRPTTFEQVRLRGRLRADEFRASRIWPRLVRDLQHDVAAFGTSRLRGSHAAA
jgi:hypothetical protein